MLCRCVGYMYAYPQVLDRYRLPNDTANETMIQTGIKEISRHLEKIDSGYLAHGNKFLTGRFMKNYLKLNILLQKISG